VVLNPPKDRFRILSSRLLNKLGFPEIVQRQERIPKALQNTFEWVYQEPKPDQNWTSFIEWLACGNGIYWITGKPGSGKSTLMKFIHGDDRTVLHLREWSKGIQLIRCAAASVALVRAPEGSLNYGQLESLDFSEKGGFLTILYEKAENKASEYINERHTTYTHKSFSDLCFPCPD
jgi:hypothetical protein